MAKIAVNLLPPEILTEYTKRKKFYKIQFAGVTVFLIMIFLASLTVALSVLQSRNVVEVQAKVSEQQQRVSSLQSVESSLSLLKNRLTTIDQYLGTPSKQTLLYQVIDKLLSSSVVINSITVDQSGEAALLITVPDSTTLDNIVSTLTTKETNENKISKISLDSLNRGRDGVYRMSLKIKGI
ncbi:hypothetical protein HY383_03795 [Candidatus Daviesbacteria bacterium]|nr:hypothetical protein [Candidatus Daviesbacteria bacterium]